MPWNRGAVVYHPDYRKKEEPLKEDVDRIALEQASQRAARPPGLVVYAGFWRRVAAFLIDQVVIAAILAIIVVIMYYSIAIPSRYIAFSVEWLYFAGMESSHRQATVGKIVMGIIVTDLDGYRISFFTATIRHLAKILSGLLLGLGYFMIAFSARKQGLHDKIAECLVVVKAYQRKWPQQGMQ
jgi:uncharacterized RDD family membrane protein YckC